MAQPRQDWLTVGLWCTLAAAVVTILAGLMIKDTTKEVAEIKPTTFALNETAPAHYLFLGQLSSGWAIQGDTDVVFPPNQNGSFCLPYLISRANYEDLKTRGALYDCAELTKVSCEGDCVSSLSHHITATPTRDDAYYLVIFGPLGSHVFTGSIVSFPQQGLGGNLIEYGLTALVPTIIGGSYSLTRAKRKGPPKD